MTLVGALSRRSAGVALASAIALFGALPTARAAELADDGAASLGAPATIRATGEVGVAPSEQGAGRTTAHPNPRVKLSYRTFSISNVDGTSVPLSGYQLDLFPVSMRFFRGGISTLAGKGHAAFAGTPVTLRYGLLGVTAGFQWPARVTPFVDGTLMGGVLSGTLDGAASPGTMTALEGAAGATGIYARGIDVGAEFYTIGRLFLSGSIGWMRTTWLGPDISALNSNTTSANSLPTKGLTTDSLTFKLGVGF